MLDALFDSNAAWALAKTEGDPGFFRRLAEQQSPDYLWIGCSDSRVPANEIVGLDPGTIFVHRNVGNVVHTGDLNCLSTLEFAIETLAVRHVIICGHYGCGGVRRALAGGEGALVDHWLAPIVELSRRLQPALTALPSEEARLDALCELNVQMQVRRIAGTPILRAAWKRGQSVTVHGWIYGIADGLLRDLDCDISSCEEADALEPLERYLARRSEPMTAIRRHAIDAFAAMEMLEPAGGFDCCDGHALGLPPR